MKNILVTGATGILGTTVLQTLLTGMAPENIHVLTRSAEKGEHLKAKGLQVFLGDYNDVPALEKAMQGVDTVLLISAGDQGNRMQEHTNVIQAAQKGGVSHFAYTGRSLQNRDTLANKLMEEHFLTEDLIKASGMKYILFQNALYMDVIPLFVGDNVFQTGIHLPAGEGKVAYALRSEQAEAMAQVLLREDFRNQTYRFTGSAAYSFYDVAEALSKISGKEVTYTALELSAFETALRSRGLPEAAIQKIAAFNADIKNGQEANVTSDLEVQLQRKPADLLTGLKELYKL
jgi:NAD(P)H dehydrogenase (quinone)